jgi:hypothetical protein
MTPDKKLKTAELIAMISISLAIGLGGASWFFYTQWKNSEEKFRNQVQASLHSGPSGSYHAFLQGRLELADTIIHTLTLPDTKIITVSSGQGIMIINDKIRKSFVKMKEDPSLKNYYQIVLKNESSTDTIGRNLTPGDFEEIEYRKNIEKSEIIR